MIFSRGGWDIAPLKLAFAALCCSLSCSTFAQLPEDDTNLPADVPPSQPLLTEASSSVPASSSSGFSWSSVRKTLDFAVGVQKFSTDLDTDSSKFGPGIELGAGLEWRPAWGALGLRAGYQLFVFSGTERNISQSYHWWAPFMDLSYAHTLGVSYLEGGVRARLYFANGSTLQFADNDFSVAAYIGPELRVHYKIAETWGLSAALGLLIDVNVPDAFVWSLPLRVGLYF